MTQYILLVHGNATTPPSPAEWGEFILIAGQSGLFEGGSAIADGILIGAQTAAPSSHIKGYMRFDSDDKARLVELLRQHPVVIHGGTVELCELPRS